MEIPAERQFQLGLVFLRMVLGLFLTCFRVLGSFLTSPNRPFARSLASVARLYLCSRRKEDPTIAAGLRPKKPALLGCSRTSSLPVPAAHKKAVESLIGFFPVVTRLAVSFPARGRATPVAGLLLTGYPRPPPPPPPAGFFSSPRSPYSCCLGMRPLTGP